MEGIMDFKDKVIYQIWPRSFCDSNADGIGDIPGIISKLDYLKKLGVDLIWLSPVYATHNRDYGYDIDDYYSINPEYGTMEDFDNLLEETKARNMGIIMDLVANHTSDCHDWFKEAISDPASPYRDYYFFREGRKAEDFPGNTLPVTNGLIPPNDWMSAFGGSAWQYDERSGQFYLTMFTPNQCDLNWENEKVRKGVYNIMKFWLDKGVAGFRMDVINVISKAPGLPNAGSGLKLAFPFKQITSLPMSHEYLKEMHNEVIGPYGCITIGEGMMTPLEELANYTRPESGEIDMMFQFDLALIGCGKLGKFDFRKFYYWNVPMFKKILKNWQEGTQREGGWLGNYLSNHDQPRQVSRFGDDGVYRRESAKALAVLNLTLRGTPFIYQGEEIGMTNCSLEPEDWKDFEAINDYAVLQDMMHLPAVFAKKIIMKMTRDNARTPMQWTSGRFAGFSEHEPWIKLNPNYRQINVEDDLKRRNSIIDLYKQLIRLRRLHRELSYGSFEMIDEKNASVISYIRKYEDRQLLVVVNMTKKVAKADLSDCPYKRGHCILGTHDLEAYSRTLTLRPYEARVYKVRPAGITNEK